jgi:hypothetical protein
MDMSRKESAGHYTIGIYSVERRGRRWIAYGTSWGRTEQIGVYATLAAAHVALTGEPMR